MMRLAAHVYKQDTIELFDCIKQEMRKHKEEVENQITKSDKQRDAAYNTISDLCKYMQRL